MLYSVVWTHVATVDGSPPVQAREAQSEAPAKPCAIGDVTDQRKLFSIAKVAMRLEETNWTLGPCRDSPQSGGLRGRAFPGKGVLENVPDPQMAHTAPHAELHWSARCLGR